MAVSLLIRAGEAQGPERHEEPPGRVDFATQIAPILEERCQSCHGAALQSSGLRLDAREAALQGGYSGPVIVAGNSAESRLIRLVSGTDEDLVMPPTGNRLASSEIRALASLGRSGRGMARGSEGGRRNSAEVRPLGVSARRQAAATFGAAQSVGTESYRPLRAGAARERGARAYQARKTRDTRPAGQSRPLRDCRRPPTDLEAFLAAPGPEAYERLVDRLLESPHYGERWAIHWLDLARYADSDGYEKDSERPYAWRWRQWIIDALNRDTPFDRFTVEQIAGDVLPGASVDQRVATGFHRNGLKNREGGVKIEQFRFEETVDRANTIGTVWLGLTVGCAQCHDHKYDPISQEDYYRLFAFMNEVDEVEMAAPMPGEMGPYLKALPEYLDRRRELLEKNRVYELQPEWEAKMVLAADNPGKWTDWDHALDAVQKYLDNGEGIVRKTRSERTDREQTKLEDHFIKNYHRVIEKDFWKELDWVSLRKELLGLRADTPDITYARAIANANPRRRTHIHLRGAWNQPGIPVEPGTPAVLPPLKQDFKHPRLALAEWLVSNDNPLTARVTVNRIWQEYFGRGIVPTSDDFGKRSPGPSHPALLDWLASEFMDNGWSLKKLHKAIVMSATYRQSSSRRPDLEERDPSK